MSCHYNTFFDDSVLFMPIKFTLPAFCTYVESEDYTRDTSLLKYNSQYLGCKQAEIWYFKRDLQPFLK